jgi:hypothetical protein
MYILPGMNANTTVNVYTFKAQLNYETILYYK